MLPSLCAIGSSVRITSEYGPYVTLQPRQPPASLWGRVGTGGRRLRPVLLPPGQFLGVGQLSDRACWPSVTVPPFVASKQGR
jgi:hypothetical protein